MASNRVLWWITGVPDTEQLPEVPIKITASLRLKAEALTGSLGKVDDEKIEHVGAWGMITNFETEEEAEIARVQLEALKTATTRQESNSQQIRHATESRLMAAPLKLFIPSIFTDLAHEIIATKLDSLQKSASIFDLAESFLAAYDNAPIVFHRFDAMPDNSDTDWYVDLQESILNAHDKIILFLRLLVTLKPNGPSHRVVIGKDFKILVDETEPKLSPAQKRCLLALACLRKRETFTVVEFTELYSGKKGVKVQVGKKDFDYASRVVKELLPYCKHVAKSGSRIVSGITWRVGVTDETLKTTLSILQRPQP